MSFKWADKYQRASLDRINSSVGYVPGNIRYVCQTANWVKWKFRDEDVFRFCAAASHWNRDFSVLKEIDTVPFLRYLHLASRRAREKKRPFDLTAEYLMDIWNKQGGRCALSGIPLDNPPNSVWDDYYCHPWRASLDRIDSSLSYVKGNVQFLCMMGNFGKNTSSNESLVSFCKAVSGKMVDPLGVAPKS